MAAITHNETRPVKAGPSVLLDALDSAIVLEPYPSGVKANATSSSAKGKGKVPWEGETIPDSEEEVERSVLNSLPRNPPKGLLDIIEISSDEDDDAVANDSAAALKIPGAWPTLAPIDVNWTTRIVTPAKKKFTAARKIVLSSEESDSDPPPKQKKSATVETLDHPPPQRPKKVVGPEVQVPKPPAERAGESLPLYADDGEPSAADDAILTLNEPRSAWKPIRHGLSTSAGPSTPQRKRPAQRQLSSSDDSDLESPVSNIPATPSRSPTKARQPGGSSRKGTKAQAASEQLRREKYAQELFDELNRVVFKNGLPKETKLNWNKRLLSTAGRAKWHRTREGVQTTEIELAIKILDCDERIRNTLSHEMCHLASWIIDQDPKEGHGKLWKSWTARVMRKRPDIDISTRHNYEITYPFQWECEKCSKIYGRFSKSIRPEECLCGSCRVGKLIPLFTTQQRANKTPKISRMAAGKSQDSPYALPRSGAKEPAKSQVLTIHGSESEPDMYESDSDLELLTTALRSATLTA